MRIGIYILILLVVVIPASAISTSVNSISNFSHIYELSSAEVILSFLNDNQSDDTLNSIFMNISPYTIINASSAWNYSGTSAYWNGSLINGSSINASFTLQAPEVVSDSKVSYNFDFTGSNSTETYSKQAPSISNDLIDPRFTLGDLDEIIILGSNFNVNGTYSDLQSGYGQVKVHYAYYSDTRGSTSTDLVNMSCIDDECTAVINTVSNSSKPYLGYYFELFDEAGNINPGRSPSPLDYWLYLDYSNPQINISGFTNNSYANNNVSLEYELIDDSLTSIVSTQVSCRFFVDQTSQIQFSHNTNGNYSLNYTHILADGVHNFYLNCTDESGQSTNSEVYQFKVDNTLPQINVSSNSIIGLNENFTFNVEDETSDIDAVLLSVNGGSYNSYSVYQVNSSNLVLGINNISINANDTAGNRLYLNTSVILDSESPIIIILNSNNSVSRNLSIHISDNYSVTVECLFESINYVENFSSNTNETHTLELEEEIYEYNISCTDEYANEAILNNYQITIDLNLPIITILNPNNNSNINTSIDYQVDDISVQNCSLFLDQVLIATNNATNFTNINLSLNSSNDYRNLSIQCEDALGQINSSELYRVYYDKLAPKVSNLSHTQMTYNKFKIRWDLDENSTNQILYWRNTNRIEIAYVNSGLNPEYTLSRLKASKTYYYVVTSCDQFNQCNESDMKSFKTGRRSSSKNTYFSYQEVAIPCVEDWSCEEWSTCNDGYETRDCTQISDCSTDELKPIETIECIVEIQTNKNQDIDESDLIDETDSDSNDKDKKEKDDEDELSEKEIEDNNLITGWVTGDGNSDLTSPLILFSILGVAILGGLLYFRIRTKVNK